MTKKKNPPNQLLRNKWFLFTIRKIKMIKHWFFNLDLNQVICHWYQKLQKLNIICYFRMISIPMGIHSGFSLGLAISLREPKLSLIFLISISIIVSMPMEWKLLYTRCDNLRRRIFHGIGVEIISNIMKMDIVRVQPNINHSILLVGTIHSHMTMMKFISAIITLLPILTSKIIYKR